MNIPPLLKGTKKKQHSSRTGHTFQNWTTNWNMSHDTWGMWLSINHENWLQFYQNMNFIIQTKASFQTFSEALGRFHNDT